MEALGPLIRNPPAWVLAVIVAIIFAHVLNIVASLLIKFTDKGYLARRLSFILELIIVGVTVIVILKMIFHQEVSGEGPKSWIDHPLSLLCFLALISFLSMVVHGLVLALAPGVRKSTPSEGQG